MKIQILTDKKALGLAAARAGAEAMRDALAQKKEIAIVVATGASQFEMFQQLVIEPDIDWRRVSVFHLDEYIGLSETHPASFRKYLQERFVAHLPTLKAFIQVNGSAVDIAAELKRLSLLIGQQDVDVCFAGIGENAHLAFNDPPADFVTKAPYLVVHLDEVCRAQQLGEGWFKTLADVPKQAISMSIQQIMRAKKIVLSVPDTRKADAVQACLEGEVSPFHPASILQTHGDCQIFLDRNSAAKLRIK